MKAVSRLWPLGQELDILPLYGGKWRDKDDGVHGVTCEKSRVFERTL